MREQGCELVCGLPHRKRVWEAILGLWVTLQGKCSGKRQWGEGDDPILYEQDERGSSQPYNQPGFRCGVTAALGQGMKGC